MKIKCVRCGKQIDSPHAGNAKYIRNQNDERTFGSVEVEKRIKAPLSPQRVDAIRLELGEKKYEKIGEDYVLKSVTPLPMSEFEKLTEIFPDEYGRREVVIQELTEVPKTAIVCPSCLREDDVVIW